MDSDSPPRWLPERWTHKLSIIIALVGAICLSVAVFDLKNPITPQKSARSGSDDARNLNPLEKEREEQVQKYMTARIEAYNNDGEASAVARMLETFIPDGSDVKPVIDIKAPTVERHEGREQLEMYLNQTKNGRPVKVKGKYVKGSNSAPVFVNGKAIVQFVLRRGPSVPILGRNVPLLATFEFQEGTTLVQTVTVTQQGKPGSDLPSPVVLSKLETEREGQVQKYMTARIEAFNAGGKASAVDQVLETFIPDGDDVKPVIDLQAPSVERHEGREQLKEYLSHPPSLPCYFVEGSNTDPVFDDGKAIVHFILRKGTSFIGKNEHLLATFEFQKGTALVQTVTVTSD